MTSRHFAVTKDETRRKESRFTLLGTTVKLYIVVVVWDGSHSSSRLKPAEADFRAQSWGPYESRPH